MFIIPDFIDMAPNRVDFFELFQHDMTDMYKFYGRLYPSPLLRLLPQVVPKRPHA